MNICLSRLCQIVVDLARGQELTLSPEEQRALFEIESIGLISTRDGFHYACVHPAMFEFHFFYRWLPQNLHRFHPRNFSGHAQ